MSVKVFMVMPFSNSFCNENYSHSIKPICDELGLKVRRADEIFSTATIYDDIIREIQEASIVIVDVSGQNPNVFYELGIAHILKQKRTIILTQEPPDTLPFDIGHFRAIHYENKYVGKATFELKLRGTLKTLIEDYRETFKNEFEMLFIALVSAKPTLLVGLVGLSKYGSVLKTDDRLQYEGTSGSTEHEQRITTSGDWFLTMVNLGMVSNEHDILLVTEKGRGFVAFLEDKGVKCYSFNKDTYDEGKIGVFERYKKRNPPKDEIN